VTAAQERLLLSGLLLLAACGRSPASKAQEATETLRSWNATLELLARERGRGAIPEHFADQVRRAAREGRRQAEAQLREARGR
jgi:hypothetical protein